MKMNEWRTDSLRTTAKVRGDLGPSTALYRSGPAPSAEDHFQRDLLPTLPAPRRAQHTETEPRGPVGATAGAEGRAQREVPSTTVTARGCLFGTRERSGYEVGMYELTGCVRPEDMGEFAPPPLAPVDEPSYENDHYDHCDKEHDSDQFPGSVVAFLVVVATSMSAPIPGPTAQIRLRLCLFFLY